jgi:hypothetical protein
VVLWYPPATRWKHLFTFDDTEVSMSGTTEAELKRFRFYKSAYAPFRRIVIALSAWVSGGTGTVKVYVDAETSPRASFSTTSTSEVFATLSFSVADLAYGPHTVYVKAVNSGSYYTYTRYLDAWGEV